MRQTWIPLLRLAGSETRLFLREPLAVVFALAFPAIVLVVLTASFGTTPADREAFGGHLAADYYVPSYVAVVIGALGLIIVPAHVAAYREHGILRRFHASAVPLRAVVGAQLLVGVLVASVGAFVVAVLGALVYGAGLPLLVPQTVLAFLLGAAAFVALGVLLGAVARTTRAAQGLGLMLFFPMWLLSGAGPPPAIMGDALAHVAGVLPLTFVVRAVQGPWLDDGPAYGSLVLLAAILVISVAASTRLLRPA